MNQQDFTIGGVLPVFQTPYLQDESVDYMTLEREIDWLFEQGADGIVMAMVSEILRLSDEERHELAERSCQFAQGRGPVVISVGSESTVTAVAFARHAETIGAHALMAIPPVATAATEEQLADYYGRVLSAVEIPVIVQDASGYVGRPMSIEFQARLLEQHGPEKVWFKPEANPIGPRLSQLRDATQNQAVVFEGTGGIALVDSYQRGIAGTIPGADLIRAIVPIWQSLEQGDLDRASRIHGPLSALVSLQTSLDAFLAIEKHLLVRQGVLENTIVRGPCSFLLDDETRREVDRLFDLMIAAAEENT